MHWEVGACIRFDGNITRSIEEALHHGMYTTQFFMGSPKSYDRQQIYQDDIDTSKTLLTRFPINVFTHFPFIANLNGSVKSLAWNGDGKMDGKMRYMMKNLEYELNTVASLGQERSGVVIHPGCYPDREVGLNTIAKTINKLNFSEGSKLLLENCAGEGRKLCKDFSEIKRVLDGVNEYNKKHIGVCVDTAHIWGQGDYNLSLRSGVDKMFEDFEREIGIERFSLLHLNDSEVSLGAKKDRHACLGSGHIWGEDFDSLIYLLERCRHHKIPIVLETHESDMLTLENIQPKN
jgi:deoxyribonuclease-4